MAAGTERIERELAGFREQVRRLQEECRADPA